MAFHDLDLPELVMIQLGWSAFSFNPCQENSVLTMRSKIG